MKAVIFGISGQDGHYLERLLTAQRIEVVGVSRNTDPACDVRDYQSVVSLIETHQPDYIFHLAADSTTRHQTLFTNHESIGTGTVNLLEAARLHAPQARIFLAGSAVQFFNDGTPINESTPFHAYSPYAAARIYSVYMARYYRETFGQMVYVGYLFNHDSPLRMVNHVNQKIVQAVLDIRGGKETSLEIGNLDVRKEFNFAGDMVAAMWQLVNQDMVFETVIGCGTAYSIREWVSYCFQKVGLSWEEHTILREGYVAEYNVLVSDPSLIQQLGWEPKTSFFQLADMMLEV